MARRSSPTTGERPGGLPARSRWEWSVLTFPFRCRWRSIHLADGRRHYSATRTCTGPTGYISTLAARLSHRAGLIRAMAASISVSPSTASDGLAGRPVAPVLAGRPAGQPADWLDTRSEPPDWAPGRR